MTVKSSSNQRQATWTLIAVLGLGGVLAAALAPDWGQGQAHTLAQVVSTLALLVAGRLLPRVPSRLAWAAPAALGLSAMWASYAQAAVLMTGHQVTAVTLLALYPAALWLGLGCAGWWWQRRRRAAPDAWSLTLLCGLCTTSPLLGDLENLALPGTEHPLHAVLGSAALWLIALGTARLARTPAAALGGVLVLGTALSGSIPATPGPPTAKRGFQVTVLQPGHALRSPNMLSRDQAEAQRGELRRLIARAPRQGLLVLGELAWPDDQVPPEDGRLLYGALSHDRLHQYNSARLGQARYDKRRLVRGTETSWLDPGHTSLVLRGSQLPPQTPPGTALGVLLCSEGLYPDRHGELMRQGARFIAVLALNNDPRAARLQRRATWNAAHMHGLSLILASNQGESLLADPNTQRQGRWKGAELLSASLQPGSPTLYHHLAPSRVWWPLLTALALFLATVHARSRTSLT